MKRRLCAGILIVVSISLIIVGVITKQPGAVMRKAVRICMECVGLG